MDKKQKTKKKLKLSTPKTRSHPSNPHFICDKEVVVQLEKLSDSVVAEMSASGCALMPEQTKKRMKLSTPKLISRPSNSHFVCDKEVVIQLERLSDSVVAEIAASGSALLPEQVYESNDDDLGINSLPDEVILEIFGYLKQNQLGRIARVCRRWDELTKDPVLWKVVNVKFSPSHRSQTTVAKSFINGLPSCVTSIKLDFIEYRDWIGTLDFTELCVQLKEKCPNVKVLIVTDSALSDSIPSVVNVCSEFLQDVKSLAFHRCMFPCNPSIVQFSGTSKIEVLDLSGCALGGYSEPHFSRMPSLKVLCLHDTNVHFYWFQDDISVLSKFHVLDLGLTGIPGMIFRAIQYYGRNLKEIYLCSVDLEEHDFTLHDSVLSHLKTICISYTYVAAQVVVSLIQSCPSLENVYVDEDLAESVAAHPFVVAQRCMSEIVQVINPWNHNHNVDYLLN